MRQKTASYCQRMTCRTKRPEVPLRDQAITISSLNAEDDPENPDLNDDGLPDPNDLDADGETGPGDEYRDSAPPR